jgi:hypothetical protein
MRDVVIGVEIGADVVEILAPEAGDAPSPPETAQCSVKQSNGLIVHSRNVANPGRLCKPCLGD